MRFNGTFTFTANTSQTFTFSGVVFKNVGGLNQAVTIYSSALGNVSAITTPNTGDIVADYASSGIAYMAYDVELNAKPTWAD
jgi:hypothetical protein